MTFASYNLIIKKLRWVNKRKIISVKILQKFQLKYANDQNLKMFNWNKAIYGKGPKPNLT
jgi:hypothetical protein